MRGEMGGMLPVDRELFGGHQEAEQSIERLEREAQILEARRIDAIADSYAAAQASDVDAFLKATEAAEDVGLMHLDVIRKLRTARATAELVTRIRNSRTPLSGGGASEQRAAA